MFHKNFSLFWKKYKFHSIVVKNSLKLMAIFLVIMLIPMGWIYHLMTSNARSHTVEENVSINRKVSGMIEALFRDAEYLAAEMISDDDVSYFMTLRENSDYSQEEKENLWKRVGAYLSGKRFIDSVYVYSGAENLICTGNECVSFDEFADNSWIDYFDEGSEYKYKVVPRTLEGVSNKVFTLIKKHSNNKSGVIINIDMHMLRKYISELINNDDIFYIIDSDGIMYSNIVTSKRESELEYKINKMILNGEASKIYKSGIGTQCISIEASPYYDWHYVRVSKSMAYENEVGSMIVMLTVFLILFIGVVIVCSVALSLNNVSQIVNLLDLFDSRKPYEYLNENEVSEVARKIIYQGKYLHIGNTFWIYIIPGLVGAWTVILYKTYFKGLPEGLIEAAKLDGASEYYIYLKIILPLSTPIIACNAFTYLLGKWNDWNTSLLYIRNSNLYSLQYLLQRIINEADYIKQMQGTVDSALIGEELPSETLRYAIAMIAAGPMMIIFPFFQKYFAKGLVVGSVKG